MVTMTTTRGLTIATTAILVAAAWVHGCGGKVNGEPGAIGAGGTVPSGGGSGQDAGLGGGGSGQDAGLGGGGDAAGAAGAGPEAGCVPSSKQCTGDTPQTCSADGQWHDEAPCAGATPVCSSGHCLASCATAGCGTLEDCFNAKICVAKTVFIAGGFSIDATEVTRAQYDAWLAANPSIAGQPPACSWNTTFMPPADCMIGVGVCTGAACDRHPQVCVDWCDALAYCSGVGKRLCGRIGGGDSPYTGFNDEATSQWFNACSSGGQNDYPYGDVYQIHVCNDMEMSASPVEVGSLPGCQSSVAGYSGVFDLSGNVWEWEDSCDGQAGPDDDCRRRGGSIAGPPQGGNQACGFDSGGLPRALTTGLGGFRCCGP